MCLICFYDAMKGAAQIREIWYGEKPDSTHVKINDVLFPTVIDKHKQQRFPENKIVRDVYEAARKGKQMDLTDITELHSRDRYSDEDFREFYRLLGTPLSCYAEVFEDDNIENPLWDDKEEE